MTLEDGIELVNDSAMKVELVSKVKSLDEILADLKVHRELQDNDEWMGDWWLELEATDKLLENIYLALVAHSKPQPQQSPLLDVVDHLNKAAEIANGLTSEYQGYESYTTDDDGDETDTQVWEIAQEMIDKLQHVGGEDETAGELEEIQQRIDAEVS